VSPLVGTKNNCQRQKNNELRSLIQKLKPNVFVTRDSRSHYPVGRLLVVFSRLFWPDAG
jgi:hypothetical protein